MAERTTVIDNPKLHEFLANEFVAEKNTSNIINPKQCLLDWFRNGEDNFNELAIQGLFKFQSGFFVNGKPFGFMPEMQHLFVNSSQEQRYKFSEPLMMDGMYDLSANLAKLLMTTSHQSGLFGFIGQILHLIAVNEQINYSVQARYKSIAMQTFNTVEIHEEALLYHRFNLHGEMELTNFVLAVSSKVEFPKDQLPRFSNWKIAIRHDDAISLSEEIMLRNLLIKQNPLKNRSVPIARAGFVRLMNTRIQEILNPVTQNSATPPPVLKNEFNSPVLPRRQLLERSTPPRPSTSPRKHRSSALKGAALYAKFAKCSSSQLFNDENNPPQNSII
jgi:hypothetical protein